jgi:hypothetical protein
MSYGITPLKMTAITKHPKRTASFHFRVMGDTAHWEECTETPLGWAGLIRAAEAALERIRVAAKKSGESDDSLPTPEDR